MATVSKIQKNYRKGKLQAAAFLELANKMGAVPLSSRDAGEIGTGGTGGNRVQSSYISTTVPISHHSGLQAKQPPPPGTAENQGKADQKTYSKRGKAKYFTYSYVKKLAELDSPLNYSYNSTLYCASEMLQEGDKITTKYCNQRWCMVCNRIRIARCINGYLPELEKFEDPQFVTLTVPNVKARDLAETLTGMVNTWRTIYKRFKRKGGKIKGIRKLECTYNDLEDTFHPHYHFIVEGKAAGEKLLAAWMELNPTAHMKGQECKPSLPGRLVELFKYFTKIITKSKIQPNGKGIIYVPALNEIFLAMRDHRVFQPFGIKKDVSEKLEILEAQTLETEYQGVIAGMQTDMEVETMVAQQALFEALHNQTTWQWNQSKGDWINPLTGAKLTGNKPAMWVDEYMIGAVF